MQDNIWSTRKYIWRIIIERTEGGVEGSITVPNKQEKDLYNIGLAQVIELHLFRLFFAILFVFSNVR